MRHAVMPALIAAALASGCTISHRYRTDDVSTIPALQGARMVVPAVLDARDNGRPSGEPSMEGKQSVHELGEVREAVADHVTRAGVQPAEWADPPETPQEAAAVLAAAQQAGIEEVMFIRYHGAVGARVCRSFAYLAVVGVVPWVVLQSIPFSRRAATAGFEAFVVSSRTGEILADSSRFAADGEAMSQWSCSPEGIMHDTMRRAVHAVLGDIAQARQMGYPHRFRVRDVPGFVVAAPEVRPQGAFVHGLGWYFPIPPGWAFDASAGDDGGARSPAGTALHAQTGWCTADGHGCGELYAEALEDEGADVLDQEELELNGRPVTDIRAVREDGVRVYQRVITWPGVAFALTCEAAPHAPASDFAACRGAFDAAQLSLVPR